MSKKPKDYGFTFGQFVDVKGKYVRVKGGYVKQKDGINRWIDDYRYWNRRHADLKNCLYIGVRTLKNGMANHSDKNKYDIDITTHFQCAVVVKNEYSKPINVPFDCIG